MKIKIALVILLLVTFAYAQQPPFSISFQPTNSFATTLAGCPQTSIGWALCPVVPTTGNPPFLAMGIGGYNGGVAFQLTGIQGPQGPKGDPGSQGPQGIAGPQGPPGIVKGSILTTTIPACTQSGCTFTITGIQ